MDVPATFVYSHPGPASGIQVPARRRASSPSLVQCLGDPVTVTTDSGADAVEHPVRRRRARRPGSRSRSRAGRCTGRQRRHRTASPGSGIAVEAHDRGRCRRPAAPATAGGASPTVPFAEGDGQNVAFGTLGLEHARQVVRVADSHRSGTPRATHVGDRPRRTATRRSSSCGRCREPRPIRTLATIDGRHVLRQLGRRDPRAGVLRRQRTARPARVASRRLRRHRATPSSRARDPGRPPRPGALAVDDAAVRRPVVPGRSAPASARSTTPRRARYASASRSRASRPARLLTACSTTACS